MINVQYQYMEKGELVTGNFIISDEDEKNT
jgi:hypothetical protein